MNKHTRGMPRTEAVILIVGGNWQRAARPRARAPRSDRRHYGSSWAAHGRSATAQQDAGVAPKKGRHDSCVGVFWACTDRTRAGTAAIQSTTVRPVVL